ncbi:MAG: amastin family protein [Desulfobacterales bacterium]|nr:amastin family protein [Desulfobacterales bacterium]
MDIFSNSFEKKWAAIILGMYGLIMIPFPWYFNESYSPGFGGVPLFVYAWILHGIAVLILIVRFSREALKRPEYKNFETIQREE